MRFPKLTNRSPSSMASHQMCSCLVAIRSILSQRRPFYPRLWPTSTCLRKTSTYGAVTLNYACACNSSRISRNVHSLDLSTGTHFTSLTKLRVINTKRRTLRCSSLQAKKTTTIRRPGALAPETGPVSTRSSRRVIPMTFSTLRRLATLPPAVASLLHHNT